ncbi:DUF1183 domain protein [Blumeria hordei DH14]|uniref:Store-operated calcium entry-associated regulatory factor n=1 Tax=Blumeria graminis f. sp. hordei (strain DH14) TaxID=546991 RepID=N1JPW2_BLUG1|nr:DUF1183 domain protein [Blumeria hordei DH14]
MQLLPLSRLLILSQIICGLKAGNENAILLSQVRTLTLRKNVKTSHRRVPSKPQLTCKGPGCAFYEVDIMRCKNQGSSYDTEDIEWSCTANLPIEFKLGSTDVSCEGYAHRHDKYVLKESCGVEYRLLLTDIGEEKYGKEFWHLDSENKSLPRAIFAVIFFAILAWILYSIFKALSVGNWHRNFRPFWGGDGNDGGDPWDSPPPYNKKWSSRGRQQPGWTPGFWSGALGGAAAGYLAGNRNGRHNNQFTERPLWSTGNSGTSFSVPTSDSMNNGSARHTSTGFGSTSRR